jgi:ABC-type Co2+ transport system permease subunit
LRLNKLYGFAERRAQASGFPEVAQSCQAPRVRNGVIIKKMAHKLTRRQLAGIAAGTAATSALVLKAVAQAPALTTPDWYKQALDSHRENSATLAAVHIPMSVEPAFHFKA